MNMSWSRLCILFNNVNENESEKHMTILRVQENICSMGITLFVFKCMLSIKRSLMQQQVFVTKLHK